MKLSIIIPVYNTEQYLCRCIDSVLAQTFADYELILIDDGSTDNSAAICDAYAKRDERIIVLHISNGGQSNARNLGLQIARGDYLGFVDSDDYIDTQMYQCMFDAAEKNNADIVSCAYEWIDEEKDIHIENMKDYQNIYTTGKEVMKNYYTKYKSLIYTSVCNKVIKRSLWKNIQFPPGRIFEDEYVIPYLYEKCEKTCLICAPLYKYIRHAESTMNREYSLKHMDDLFMAQNHIQFFEFHKEYSQYRYSQEAYLSYYLKNYLTIYNHYPQYKKELKTYTQELRKMLLSILSNPVICEMKKIILLCSTISPTLAEKLAFKYFPEFIHDK